MRRAFPPTVNQTQTVVLALTLLSFALILFRLDGQSLRGDEAFATLFASRPLAEIIAELRLSEPHPPLYYVGLHLWPRLASDSELALRLFSGFFGVLAVPLTYLFAQTLFRRRDLSLVAAALIAVNPYLLWHSRDARMYGALPCLLTPGSRPLRSLLS